MGYRPKYFKLYELIGPKTYEKYKKKPDYIWSRLNANVLEAADIIREHYGLPVIINNWYNGGQYKESGLRDFTTKTGAKFSAHKFGLALDLKIPGMKAEKVINDIKNNKLPTRFYGLINCVEKAEKTPTWIHIACLNYMNDGIVWV